MPVIDTTSRMSRAARLWTSCLLLLVGCGPAERLRFENVWVEVSATRAVVRFNTSLPSTCEIHYGRSADSLDQRALDPQMIAGEFSLNHEVPLEDLQPQTEYFFRPVASTAAGSVFEGELQSFTTLPGTRGTSLVNVALLSEGSAVTSVSSNWGGGGMDSPYGAHRALDGAMGTEWSSQGDGDGAFLELRLSRERRVHSVGYRSRRMSDGTSIVTRFQWVLNGTVTVGPFDTPDPDQLYTFVLTDPVAVQTARFEVLASSGGNTGARELQLWAEP